MSTLVQYIIVFIILLAVIVWILIRLFRKKPTRRSSCCGCALSDTCSRNGREASNLPK